MNWQGVGASVRDRASLAGRDAFAARLGVDPRALAALRIALGLLLLADLVIRAGDLVAFYTDAGVLPRTLLREEFGGLARLSFHTVSGEAWAQAALFLLAGAFAVALLVGYRTTLVTVVSFAFLVSLHARNPVLLNGGDSVLRRLLFWGIFLPLGGRWSLDARRAGTADRRRRVVSVATVALLVQVVLVYAVNAAFKLRGEAWLRGDALRYVFGLDRLTVLLGDVLAQYPTLLGPLGHLWLAAVLASPLLLLLAGRARIALVALLAAMHLGMLVTLRLGLFPLVSVAGLLAFLPPSVWDAVERRVVGSRLAGVLTAAGDRTHRLLPRHGGRSVTPPALRRLTRRLVPVVVAALLGFVLLWNAAALGYADVPEGVASTVDPAQHRWDMFAPEPPGVDTWYVVPGHLESGGTVDALQREPVDWDRPAEPARTYPSHRWYMYLVDLQRPAYRGLRPAFVDYLCDRWNADHEDDLERVTVYVVEQPTRLDGPAPTRRVELIERACPTSA